MSIARIVGAVITLATVLPAGLLSQPRIALSDTLFDLGSVYAGSVITKKVTITNKGDKTLRILQVNAQCNCTSVQLPSDSILPHSSEVMMLTVNTTYTSGEVHKNILVLSNDPVSRISYIFLNLTIKEAVQVNVRDLVFMQIDSSTPMMRTVRLKNLWDKPFGVLSVSDSSGVLEGTFTRKELKPGDSTFISINLAKHVEKKAEGILRIRTDCRSQGTVGLRYIVSGWKE